MYYSGAQILIKLLEKFGIRKIPGIPGGANLPIYSALADSSIEHILARHEQGAGFIAQGMARSTGKPAVCFATSGPGATNLLTAIADAKLDSVPIIAITGQVPTTYLGTDAFQEIDTYGLTLPITKHNFLIRSPAELLEVIPEAFRIARDGRPGPVAIDIPKDVQFEKIKVSKWPSPKRTKIKKIDQKTIRKIAQEINKAKKPLLYIGGGIISSGAHLALRKFSGKNSIPVTSTLMGLGAFLPQGSLYLGMLGMHGARYTNLLLKETDLLLAFGVRFDDRATGNIKEFCSQAKIIHIDIDYAEIDKLKKTNISIAGDIKQALEQILPYLRRDARRQWLAHIEKFKKEYPFFMPAKKYFFQPLNFIQAINRHLAPQDIITTDVGQHQMWVAQAYTFSYPRTFLTSGGLGTMGFGFPAAIGAALANPGRRAVCISGDGSFLMNIQELATLADLNLDVAVIIMNNKNLGLVRQQQELFYGKKYIGTFFKSNPDFTKIAESFGIRGYDLGKAKQPAKMLDEALRKKGPCVINAPIHYAENVMPMVAPGAANSEMIGGQEYE
ncbi:MAG: biosynthetic-type acetolactate synthase large subunit [Candidatus Omnitrophica bacterium]|nr:biosynthetic-type acetolactate synthase large subunit [Candidatus Omnitrophota bacterium]MDD5430395.1 biosynthetic-type acetolactate synthase large subunit [Candidatus Omnitrophota bacterium]